MYPSNSSVCRFTMPVEVTVHLRTHKREEKVFDVLLTAASKVDLSRLERLHSESWRLLGLNLSGFEARAARQVWVP